MAIITEEMKEAVKNNRALPGNEPFITQYWILEILNCWYHGPYDPIWFGYDILQEELKEKWSNVPMKIIKVHMEQIKEEGYAELNTTWDGDGMLSGCGYFITKLGREVFVSHLLNQGA